MTESHYDILVIGAGAAGSAASSMALERGARVALIERDQIGGTCLNYGCDPTKTLLHIAAMLHQARRGSIYGLRFSGIDYDWGAVQNYVHHVINQIRGGTSEQACVHLQQQGLEVIKGEARFISPHAVNVAGQTIYAEQIVIATGNETVVPPIEGLKAAGFITNKEAVSLPTLPRRLAIIGGGAIGLEFGQMFQRFGVQVTVLERSSNLLEKEDRELADMLCALLQDEGLSMETGVNIQRIRHTPHGKKLIYQDAEGEKKILTVDEILLSAGRKPDLETLNLEAAGVQMAGKGIEVDNMLRTNIPHIWAAGDVTGGYQFTHFATEQGRVAGYNATAGQPRPFEPRVIPWVTYTDPSLAHVGQTEEQLYEAGVPYRVSRVHFADIERAVASGRIEGLYKILVDDQGHILGGHILGVDAGELLAPLIVAMQANMPVSELAATIMPYPNRVEGARQAAGQF